MRFVTASATAVALAIGTSTFAQFAITEVRTGSGANEYVEISGKPGASLNGVTFLIIGDGTTSGENQTRSGVVEWIWHFGPKDVIGPNGYLVLHNPAMSQLTVDPNATAVAWTDGEGDTGFEASDNMTFMLITGFSGTDDWVGRAPNSGAGGQDLDTDDDGVFDVVIWDSIIDSVAIKDTDGATPNPGTDWWYSDTTVGPYISRSVIHATGGTLIAGWDFQTVTHPTYPNPEGGTPIVAIPNTPTLFNANAGSGKLYLDGSYGSSSWTVTDNSNTTQLNTFAGSSANTSPWGLSTVTSGAACLAVVGQSANGYSAVFQFSMAGIAGLNVAYTTQRSGSGFNSQQWAWSADGETWTDIDNITDIPSSFGSAVKSLLPLNDLDGLEEAYLRVTFTGASAAAGNNRLDNITFVSNPVDKDIVVTNYGVPVHVFRNGSTWSYGPGSATDGYDTPGAANYVLPALGCGVEESGLCEAPHFGPYCSSACCCELICAVDPFCCQVRWDAICVEQTVDCAESCSSSGKCIADLNLDGLVNGADLGLLLSSWGSEVNDQNGDGIVNGADLGLLLAAWGPCS